jgi:arsenical pump membrane protein
VLTDTATLVLPLAAFLTAAIWLASFGERAGLAARAATALERAAGGRRGRLYALACLLCCGLTAAVSLDGAVTLMVPLVLALAPELRRPLLLATVGAANASSLAVPQGNPTNLIVMHELGLGPAEFSRRLLLPALAATLLCVAAVAWRERAALRGSVRPSEAPARPAPVAGEHAALAPSERVALAAVLLAGLAGLILPWLGVAPWWALCGAALLCFAAARMLRLPTPPLAVPWRVIGQVAALVLAFEAVKGHLHLGPPGTSAAALVALALGAGLLAAAVNNLPASVALGGLLGGAALPAFAALAGLSVGALATPHGSAATLIAFDRAGERPSRGCYVKLWLPTASLATAAAALLVALG